jgi:nucleotide-binding universal stress UspA family protein
MEHVMYKKIVVPLDGSDAAEQVLPHAEALAVKFGASLVFLRAVEPPAVPPLVAPGGTPMVHPAGVVDVRPLQAAERQEAERYLAAATETLRARGIAVSAEQPEGPAPDAILRRARELSADLIAMTSHGRGGVGRLIFGSVADSVTRNSPCAVLVVPVRE